MTITNYGFDGTVDEVQFAKMARHFGSDSEFPADDDFKPTVSGSADRTVLFAPGQAYGDGVLTVSDAAASKQLAPVGSGSRWDTIVLRRVWTPPGGTTTLVAVQGTATMALANGVQSAPGDQADQVICLARVQAGQSLVQEIRDYRLRSSRVIQAPSLPAVRPPRLGMEVVLPDRTRWRRELGDSFNPAWIKQDVAKSVAFSRSAGSGWSVASPMVSRCLVDSSGTEVQYDFQARRSGIGFRFAADGGQVDEVVMTLSGGPLPDPGFHVPVHFYVFGGGTYTASQNGLPAFGYLDSTGQLMITSGLPNSYITQRTTVTDVSLRASVRFRKAA